MTIKYGQFCFKGRVIDLSHLAYSLRRSLNHPDLLLSNVVVQEVALLREAGLVPCYQKVLRRLASTGFKKDGSDAIQVLELADHIEQLSENP